MALLDVSELFGDPLFMETVGVQIVRGVLLVDQNGRANITYGQPFDIVANVQATGNSTLQLLPEDARIENTVTVYTMTPIYVQTDSTVADRLLWDNRIWSCVTVNDYANYGAGFYMAVFKQLQLTENGPTTP